MSFEELYGKLNPEQKQAVDTVEGPVMVIAGPGTGKTTVLTLRIANILRQTDTPPSGILAITYTDAGVKAMRTKLQELIGAQAHEVHIYTFHGFASAMIAEYHDHFPHLENLRQITDVEQESLIRSILTEQKYKDIRPIGRPDKYLSAIISAISEAKREALSPQDVSQHAKEAINRITSDESSISSRGATKGELKAEAKERIKKCERTALFADVYASYEVQKQKAGLMDFNDLIIELLAALENDELLLRLIQERFLYILVDEHQDTNDAQNLIVRFIAEFFDTPNVFVVGDEKQAIFRFQGASVENFLALEKQWPSVQTITLKTNYRSHQHILDASFAMIEQNYAPSEYRHLRIPLRSDSQESLRPIEVVLGENVSAVEQFLVEQIKTIVDTEPTATVAVITRRNRELERTLQVLEAAGVSVASQRSIDIFTHPAGEIFFNLITYLTNPTRIDALAYTMVAGLWGLNLADAADLIRTMRSGKKIDLKKQLQALQKIQKAFTDDDPVGFIVHACRESGLAEVVAQNPVSVTVWRGIVSLAESLVHDRKIVSPQELMSALLDYRLSAELRTVKVSVGAPDSTVTAMTAHGSKGLEFDYVFLPYATEEAWVGRPRGVSFILPSTPATSSDIRDMRRLFYVALTRARKHVTVLCGRKESDGKAQTPLRFIDELDQKSVSVVSLARRDTEVPSVKNTTERAGLSVATTNLAKHVLVTSGLSVTALNHFFEDPKKFLYESVLKMPQAPSVSAEKGNAMHAAMDHVWRAQETDPEKIEAIIVDVVETHLSNSFLPKADKERLQHELSESAPQVAVALASHFKTNGTVFSEYWVELDFTVSIGGEEITIPLHGKLDAIIETEQDIQIFDYKTRQAMSANAVRGKTKSSDDKFFRQLVFYHLLMESEAARKGKRLTTSLVFISPDKKGRCPVLTLSVEESDLLHLKDEIQLLIDYVWSGKLEDLA